MFSKNVLHEISKEIISPFQLSVQRIPTGWSDRLHSEQDDHATADDLAQDEWGEAVREPKGRACIEPGFSFQFPM